VGISDRGDKNKKELQKIVKIFECPREVSARVVSGLHQSKVLMDKTGKEGSEDSYGGGAMGI